MDNYAVIEINGTQYKVGEGDELLTDRLSSEKPEAKVLLWVKDGKAQIGKPYLTKTKVRFKILEREIKGKKLTVQTFKAKSRYRRKKGFRPLHTRLLVEKIG